MENNKGLIYATINKRRITLSVVILIFIIGLLCYVSLPKQQYPVIQLPMVIIYTVYPGASATDMEELVTSKIEDKCMAADGFDSVTSDSYNSTSVVKINFNRDLTEEELQDNIDKLRNEIQDLKENELPSGITTLNFNDNAFDTSGYVIAFTSDTKSNEELVQRAEELKDELIGNQGVSRVEVDGEIQRQVKVTVDNEKLNHINLSLAELSGIVGYQNTIVPVGTVEFDNDELFINTSGKLQSLEEIENITVAVDTQTGAITKLRDIAKVEMVYDEDAKKYSFNGKEAVILSLYFEEGVNVLEVGEQMRQRVEKFSEKLPEDIQIDKVIYLPDDVSKSINDFVVNLIESVVIVLVVIMIGMSIRNGSIVAVAIPLTIFVSFIAMKIFGVDVQFVSLASLIIALGMLVDNAIVVSDAIQVRIDNDEERMSACVNGAKEVALPVLTSTLTTVVMFAVFFALPGTIKNFILSLPIVVISALIASYVVSMLVTPVMCYFRIKKSTEKPEKKYSLKQLCANMVDMGVRHKVLTLSIAFGSIIVAVLILSRTSLELVPKSDKSLLDITITTDNLYDIRKTENAVKAAEGILAKYDEIEYYLASSGGRIPKYEFTALPGTDSTNLGNIVVRLNLDNSDITKDKAEFCKILGDELSQALAGSRVVVKEMGIIPSSSEPIQINVCGNDFNVLNQASDKVVSLLNANEGTNDVFSDRKIKTYNYYVDMKNDSLTSCGLTKAEVQNELNIAMMGREATTYRKDSKEYPVIIGTDIKDMKTIEGLKVKSSVSGEKYKIKQIANINIENDYGVISRYNGKRCVTVTSQTKNGASPVDIQNKVKKELEKENIEGVTFVYQGDSDIFDEIMHPLGIAAAIGTIIIFIILYIQFYSVKRSLVVVLSIPFGMIGSALGLWLTNQKLSFLAILGIISLIGVVVNNAIVLVDYMDRGLENCKDVYKVCKDAVLMRFRPIMLSTTTTVLGLLPLVISGDVLFKGLATAFMCGLLANLCFIFVVIPIFYIGFIGKEQGLKN